MSKKNCTLPPSIRQDVTDVISYILRNPSIRTAIRYLNLDTTVKATRHKTSRRQSIVVVTLGRPNYRERQFIKATKKAKEPFPIKRTQIHFLSGRSTHE